MDGWMDGWMDGLIDWMDGWVGVLDGWMDGVLCFQHYFSRSKATAHIIHVFSWVSTVLGLGPEVCCPRTILQKTKWLEHRTPGFKRFTTEPHRTPKYICN